MAKGNKRHILIVRTYNNEIVRIVRNRSSDSSAF